MSFTKKLLFATFCVTVIIFITAIVLKKYLPKYEFAFPLMISAIALAMSLMAAFKNELFSFDLHLVPGSITLAVPSAPSHKSLALIYNLSFINGGYGHGIVEWVALKVSSPESTKLYTPVAEINYEKFIQGKRILHAENIIGTFTSFILGSKEAVHHSILFSQEEVNKDYPFKEWIPNKYKFELWAKVSDKSQAHMIHAQEFEINQQMIDGYFAGEGSVLTNLKIKIQ
jgi:hypothetical protein